MFEYLSTWLSAGTAFEGSETFRWKRTQGRVGGGGGRGGGRGGTEDGPTSF